jgi:hypothetical protein
MGNSVPHNTENATPTSSRLLKRNAASRLTTDSSCTSALSDGHLVYSSVKERMPQTTRNARKK